MTQERKKATKVNDVVESVSNKKTVRKSPKTDEVIQDTDINKEIDLLIEETNKKNMMLRMETTSKDDVTLFKEDVNVENIINIVPEDKYIKDNIIINNDVVKNDKNTENKIFFRKDNTVINNVKNLLNEKPLEHKDIYNNYLYDNNMEFEIYYRGNKIFDSITSKRDNLTFENEYFVIFGKKMLYNGTRIVQKNKIF
jgi:hypothetical protein